MTFATYMLRCADGSYYVGHSEDLTSRIAAHCSGLIEGYTSSRLPIELVWSQAFSERHEALAAERQIKGWSRAKKEALIRGDWDEVQMLARKLFLRHESFDTPPLAATQDERDEGHLPPGAPRSITNNSLILSSGTSEAEGRVSKDDPLILSSESSEAEGRVSKDPTSDPLILSSGLSEAERSRRPRIEGPVIILVNPQLGQNIGKAARAMLNFGLTDLRLVAPRDGWPNPDAGPAASGADIVLEQAQVFGTVAEAIADCSLVFASTVRKRDIMTPVVGPEEMARAIHASPARTAILFGPERSGLATEDVVLASHIVTVPINPEFGSLNLAQAVILLAYEWSRGAGLSQPTLFETEPRAPTAELDGLVGQLEEALDGAGYFYPPERTQATRNTIRTILSKPGWSSREVKALRGMLRALTQPPRRRSNSSSS